MGWKDYLRDEMIDANIVVGTDSNNYLCKLNHRSKAENRPITGANWATYWELTVDSGLAWLVDTNYHIKQCDQELNGLNNSVASINASITHWQHWRDIYQGIQGDCKTNLEARIIAKGFVAGSHQPAWQSGHSYSYGAFIRPTTPNGYVYTAQTPVNPFPPPDYLDGTSGGTEPLWPTVIGATVVDNDITWYCYQLATIVFTPGAGYGITNLTAWTVYDNPGSYVIYVYLGTGWDSDSIIIKAITDWNTMNPLINDSIYGALAMITNLGTALTLVTNWKNSISARNPILEDYE